MLSATASRNVTSAGAKGSCCCQPCVIPVLLLAGTLPHGALARGAGAEHGGSQGCAHLIPRAKGKSSTRPLWAHKAPVSVASCELLYMGLGLGMAAFVLLVSLQPGPITSVEAASAFSQNQQESTGGIRPELNTSKA